MQFSSCSVPKGTQIRTRTIGTRTHLWGFALDNQWAIEVDPAIPAKDGYDSLPVTQQAVDSETVELGIHNFEHSAQKLFKIHFGGRYFKD